MDTEIQGLPAEYKGLSDKEARFIDEYLVDLNKTQAAIRAGYAPTSASPAATRILGKPAAAEALQHALRRRRERTEIDQDWVTERLRMIVDRCMQMEPVYEKDRETGELVETGFYKFDASNARAALELLGKSKGMFMSVNMNLDSDDLGVVRLPGKKPVGAPIGADAEDAEYEQVFDDKPGDEGGSDASGS